MLYVHASDSEGQKLICVFGLGRGQPAQLKHTVVFSYTLSLLIDPSPSIKASVLNHAKLISRSNIARLGTLVC